MTAESGGERPAASVAIVVPLSNRSTLTADEEISLRHLRHYLGGYDAYAVTPEGLDIEIPGLEPRPFDRSFFGSTAAHRRLMLSRGFYEAFRAYEYMLIYHLDALVFSDRLDEWCAAGYDYIGAPWLKSMFDPRLPVQAGLARAGNGGFSLRRVESFLRVLTSDRYAVDPKTYAQKRYGNLPVRRKIATLPRRYALRLRALNNVRREVAGITYNEDFFWADRAVWFAPDFRVAPPEVALAFAFEAEPRACFEWNQRRLPFGCHAWPRYDRAFWEPYLLGDEAEQGAGRLAGDAAGG